MRFLDRDGYQIGENWKEKRGKRIREITPPASPERERAGPFAVIYFLITIYYFLK
jgi:hypothetical protein